DVDRPSALARLSEALAACAITGPKSNITFLEALVRHPAIVEGRIDTGYLDRHPQEFLPAPDAGAQHVAAAAVAWLLDEETRQREQAARSADPTSPWAMADGWRLGHAGNRRLAFLHRGERIELVVQGTAGDYRIAHGSRLLEVAGARLSGTALSARFNGMGRRFQVSQRPQSIDIHD